MRIVLVAIFWFGLNLLAIWLPAWWLWKQFISPQLGPPSLNFLESTGLLIYAWLVAHGLANRTFLLLVNNLFKQKLKQALN